MIALIAALLAAPSLPVTQRGPWVEMQAGPQVLFRSRGAGIGLFGPPRPLEVFRKTSRYFRHAPTSIIAARRS